MLTNRRVYPRAVVRLRGRLRAQGSTSWCDALVYDLSAGGAGVHVSSVLEVGAEVVLEIALPAAEGAEAHRFEALCLVVRTGKPARSDPLRPHLAGLHFLAIEPEDTERIRAYVWERLPREEQ